MKSEGKRLIHWVYLCGFPLFYALEIILSRADVKHRYGGLLALYGRSEEGMQLMGIDLEIKLIVGGGEGNVCQQHLHNRHTMVTVLLCNIQHFLNVL